jgi:alpha-1,2-mannosyltransferase
MNADTVAGEARRATAVLTTRRALWAVTLSVALFASLTALHRHVTGFVVMSDFFDLSVYRAGGQALLDGTPLYDRALHGGAYSFTYPPFAAMLFTPLTVGPEGLWQALVFPVGVVLLAGSVHLSLRCLGGVRDRASRYAAVAGLTAVLVWLEPVSWTLYLGQINLVLMLVVLADLTGGTRTAGGAGARSGVRGGAGGWSGWRGVGVGVAAGIKLTPALFIVHLLLTRQYRAAATATVTALCTVALSLLVAPGDTRTYWGGTFLRTDRVGVVASQMNQSLSGTLTRITGGAQPPFALWAILAAAVVATGLGVAAAVHRGGMPLLGIALCGLTSAVVSPISWSHHWVWFVPLVVVVLFSGRSALDGNPLGSGGLATGPLGKGGPGPLDGNALGRWRLRVLAVFFLVVFAWPLHFFTGHRMDAAPLGLVALPPWHGLEALYGNTYLYLYVAALAYTVAVLRAPRVTAAATTAPLRLRA